MTLIAVRADARRIRRLSARLATALMLTLATSALAEPVARPNPAITAEGNGLIGHWAFDGSLDDSSANGLHGIDAGDALGFGQGKSGQALVLGPNAYAVLPIELSDVHFPGLQIDFAIRLPALPTDEAARRKVPTNPVVLAFGDSVRLGGMGTEEPYLTVYRTGVAAGSPRELRLPREQWVDVSIRADIAGSDAGQQVTIRVSTPYGDAEQTRAPGRWKRTTALTIGSASGVPAGVAVDDLRIRATQPAIAAPTALDPPADSGGGGEPIAVYAFDGNAEPSIGRPTLSAKGTSATTGRHGQALAISAEGSIELPLDLRHASHPLQTLSLWLRPDSLNGLPEDEKAKRHTATVLQGAGTHLLLSRLDTGMATVRIDREGASVASAFRHQIPVGQWSHIGIVSRLVDGTDRQGNPERQIEVTLHAGGYVSQSRKRYRPTSKPPIVRVGASNAAGSRGFAGAIDGLEVSPGTSTAAAMLAIAQSGGTQQINRSMLAKTQPTELRAGGPAIDSLQRTGVTGLPGSETNRPPIDTTALPGSSLTTVPGPKAPAAGPRNPIEPPVNVGADPLVSARENSASPIESNPIDRTGDPVVAVTDSPDPRSQASAAATAPGSGVGNQIDPSALRTPPSSEPGDWSIRVESGDATRRGYPGQSIRLRVQTRRTGGANALISKARVDLDSDVCMNKTIRTLPATTTYQSVEFSCVPQSHKALGLDSALRREGRLTLRLLAPGGAPLQDANPDNNSVSVDLALEAFDWRIDSIRRDGSGPIKPGDTVMFRTTVSKRVARPRHLTGVLELALRDGSRLLNQGARRFRLFQNGSAEVGIEITIPKSYQPTANGRVTLTASLQAPDDGEQRNNRKRVGLRITAAEPEAPPWKQNPSAFDWPDLQVRSEIGGKRGPDAIETLSVLQHNEWVTDLQFLATTRGTRKVVCGVTLKSHTQSMKQSYCGQDARPIPIADNRLSETSLNAIAGLNICRYADADQLTEVGLLKKNANRDGSLAYGTENPNRLDLGCGERVAHAQCPETAVATGIRVHYRDHIWERNLEKEIVGLQLLCTQPQPKGSRP